MNYQTFKPHSDLASLVNLYWTLEVSAEDSSQKQRIVPDGCIELAFILGDDIKRYTSEDDYILQPRAMVLGQTMDPFTFNQQDTSTHLQSVFFTPMDLRISFQNLYKT